MCSVPPSSHPSPNTLARASREKSPMNNLKELNPVPTSIQTSSSWYEVTGKVSEGHLRAGTRVEAAKKWREATSYAERYMAKAEVFPEGLQTGRIWGIWNPKLLPVWWETAQVSLRDAFRIRRIYRKLARKKGSGSLHSITVFVRHENVVKLLEFLGYRVE